MSSTEELVRLAQRGDTTAFSELVRRYQRASILSAYAVLGDFHASQDATQEALVIAYRKIQSLREPASFGPWLLQTVRRTAIRLQQKQSPELIGTENMDRSPPQDADWLAKYEEVIEQLARLPENERIVAVMRYVDGLSVKGIAQSTGRPIGTVTKNFHAGCNDYAIGYRSNHEITKRNRRRPEEHW